MKFLVLGVPCVEWVNGNIDFLTGHQASLLTELLAAESHVVSVDSLLEALYGGAAPRVPVRALHAHIARLRNRLRQWEPMGPGPDRILTRPHGYELKVTWQETDAGLFLNAVALARKLLPNDPSATIEILEPALASHRGPVLDGVAVGHGGSRLTARLDDARLEAAEMLARARLEGGRVGDAILDLQSLVRDNPLDERFAGLLMSALTRHGRSGEAFGAYLRLYWASLDELGVEPSAELNIRALTDLRRAPHLHTSHQLASHAPVEIQEIRRPSDPLHPPSSPDSPFSDFADPGSFVCMVRSPAYQEGASITPSARQDGKEALSGFCRVEGKTVAVADVNAQAPSGDRDSSGGSVAVKRALEYAANRRLPLIMFMRSAQSDDGDAGTASVPRFALIRTVAQLREDIPRIVVLRGNPDVHMARMAELGDVVISTAALPATPAPRSGALWITLRDPAQANATARRLLAYLPDQASDGRGLRPKQEEQTLPGRTPRTGTHVLIDAIADEGTVLELMAEAGRGVVTALGHIDGRPIGIIASDPAERECPLLTTETSHKCAQLVRLCSRWNIPLLNLVDVPALPSVRESGAVDFTGQGWELLRAFAEARVPRISVLVGRAEGWTGAIMGSRATGADAVYAWPDARWSSEEVGSVDAVIAPAETRTVVGALLETFEARRPGKAG